MKSNPENTVPFKSYIKKTVKFVRNFDLKVKNLTVYLILREQDDNDFIYPDEFPTRLNPASGSSLIDVAYVDEDHPRRGGIRFLVYMDDETLLQSEINHCLFDN